MPQQVRTTFWTIALAACLSPAASFQHALRTRQSSPQLARSAFAPSQHLPLQPPPVHELSRRSTGFCSVVRGGHARSAPRSACDVRMMSKGAAEADDGGAYTLYPQRWVQLLYLSLLALLSDWVCFSVAAAPEVWKETYNHDPATLIDIFLFTNVLFCLLEPGIVRRFGLRDVIITAGATMAAGCLLRSGIPFTGSELQPYNAVVAGTVLVGAAQPFFQCTPPLLSATWFGADERALATAIAINFNQVGIATAFLVGGSMAGDATGLGSYFSVISAASLAVTLGAFIQFQEQPPTPPTASAAAKLKEKDADAPNFLVTAGELLKTPGFLPPLVAFVASIGISNVVSAFVGDELRASGFVEQGTIDLAGAGFQAAIVGGGIVLGGYVDRTKEYKQVTCLCLGAALVLLLALGYEGAVPKPLVLAILLSLGALVGPVQPINAELAVEVAYPADENSIEALQQLCGNLFSALLVPIAERAGEMDLRSLPGVGQVGAGLRGDYALLGFIALCGLGYFSTFNSELKRSFIDCAGDEQISACDTVVAEVEGARAAAADADSRSGSSPLEQLAKGPNPAPSADDDIKR